MSASAQDAVVLERWWQHFVDHGKVPDELAFVQGRLIRSVHRGELPSGPVFVKVMTFPRAKDRLRYAFRALPAAHEAEMLEATREVGILCPEVVAVRTKRRFLLPHRSMLVLRSLDLCSESGAAPAQDRLHEEVEVAAQLLEAGIYHRDLHTENFVRTGSRALAVLDMQSASRSSQAARPASSARVAVAARLLRDRHGIDRGQALAYMLSRSLLCSEEDAASAERLAEQEARHYRASRVRRCLMNSTDFECRYRWLGTEYRRRGELGEGRWWSGGRRCKRAWLGQRARNLEHGTPLAFRAFFAKWWWLGGGGALYVPSEWSDERIEIELRKAAAATAGR